MPIPKGSLSPEEGVVRQWEFFGITDDDPYWTPPRRAEPDTVAILPDLDDEDEDLIPEPAA
jgi:DNA gyrase inhibitor GyrI